MIYSVVRDVGVFRIVLLCCVIANTCADSCRVLGEFMNGDVEYSGFSPGSTATFQCNNGYILIGNESRDCMADGIWSGSAPTCKRSCSHPPELSFAQIVELPASLYFPSGIYIQYLCLPGFIRDLFKLPVVVCQENFIWSEIPEFCIRVQCGNPEGILNGKVEGSGTVFGSTATYSCNDGYDLIGSAQRQCTADAVWSDSKPTCIPMTTTANPFNSTPVTDLNQQTTDIISNVTLTIPPIESECSKIHALQETIRDCTSTPEDWTKYLQVHYLYLQIENLKLDIERKKKEA
ncbi:complement decay-accelerating factor-like [Pelodytes ibericus]